MTILKNSLEFSGGLGNLSAYKLPGMNQTIIRTKGGADKKKILNSPSFKLTRDNYTEFSACAKMGGSIRRSMLALAPLADYNYTPMLNSHLSELSRAPLRTLNKKESSDSLH